MSCAKLSTREKFNWQKNARTVEYKSIVEPDVTANSEPSVDHWTVSPSDIRHIAMNVRSVSA